LNRNFGFNWHAESEEAAGAGRRGVEVSRKVADAAGFSSWAWQAGERSWRFHWAPGGRSTADGGANRRRSAEAMWAGARRGRRACAPIGCGCDGTGAAASDGWSRPYVGVPGFRSGQWGRATGWFIQMGTQAGG